MKKIISPIFILFLMLIGFSASAQQPVDKEKEPETSSSSSDRVESSYYHIKGTHLLNLGLSFPNVANASINIIGSLLGNDVEAKSGPKLTLSYEYGLTEQIGIGVTAGYFSSKTGKIPFSVDVGGILDVCNPLSSDFNLNACLSGGGGVIDTNKESEYRIDTYSLGGRFAVRRNKFMGIEKIDIYGSTEVGYNFVRYKNTLDSDAEVQKVNLPTFFYIVRGGARYYLTPKLGLYGEFGYGNITLFNVGATYRFFKEK